MTCAQQAANDARLAAVVYAVFIGLNVVAILSFYGWRRARAPWRSLLFTLFVLCGLLVFDSFVYTIVPQPAPKTPVHACR